MKKLILGAIAVSAIAAPVASQAHGIAVETPAGTYYVNEEDPSIWEETNGDSGLQTAAHTHAGEDGEMGTDDDVTVPPDTKLLP